MKKSLFALLLFPFYCLHAQSLQLENNRFRAGDEIVKQQVEYKDPGRAGENVIWNFGELKEVNPKYKLTYKSPEISLSDTSEVYIMGRDTFSVEGVVLDALISGLEHRTFYYNQYRNDSLLLLGHENSTTLLQYHPSLVLMKFPFVYGDSVSNVYESKALYSQRIDIESEGGYTVKADAYGKMILPSGDTLNHVMRVKSIQTFYGPDSIDVTKEVLQMTVENYKWYSLGYRYPIFETIHTINSNKEDYFKTAFFYPPEDHVYLSDDDKNLAVLDSLANIEKTELDPESAGWLAKNFSYNFYPNPVQTNLNIEYKLETEANIEINLYSDNQLLKTIQLKKINKGFYEEWLDCSSLQQGTYVLQIKINNHIVSSVILKK